MPGVNGQRARPRERQGCTDCVRRSMPALRLDSSANLGMTKRLEGRSLQRDSSVNLGMTECLEGQGLQRDYLENLGMAIVRWSLRLLSIKGLSGPAETRDFGLGVLDTPAHLSMIAFASTRTYQLDNWEP